MTGFRQGASVLALPLILLGSFAELLSSLFYKNRILSDSSLYVLDKTCYNVGLHSGVCAELNVQHAAFKLIAVVLAIALSYACFYLIPRETHHFRNFQIRSSFRHSHKFSIPFLQGILAAISLGIGALFVVSGKFPSTFFENYDRQIYLENYRMVILSASFAWPIVIQIGDWFFFQRYYLLAFKAFALACLIAYVTSYRFSFLLSIILSLFYLLKYFWISRNRFKDLIFSISSHARSSLVLFFASASIIVIISLFSNLNSGFTYATKVDSTLRRIANGSLYSALSYRYMNAHQLVCESNVASTDFPSLKKSCDMPLKGVIASTRAIYDLSYPRGGDGGFSGTVTVGIWGDLYTIMQGKIWPTFFTYTTLLVFIGTTVPKMSIFEIYIVICVCRWYVGGIYDMYDNIIIGIMFLSVVFWAAKKSFASNDLQNK